MLAPPCVAPQSPQIFMEPPHDFFKGISFDRIIGAMCCITSIWYVIAKSLPKEALTRSLAQIDESPKVLHNSATIPSRPYHSPVIPSIVYTSAGTT